MAGKPLISNRFRINGLVVRTIFTSDRLLLCPNCCLNIEKHVIVINVEGSKIKINAVFDPQVGICSRRKSFIFEPSSEDALALWIQRLQNCMDSLETKHQGHAKEVAYWLDLSKYDGIVCASGDGVLVEVVTGLLEREDWDTGTRMPIGVIPAGTGNGMVKSLLDSVRQPCSAFLHDTCHNSSIVLDRWMGSARMDFYALKRICHLRKYKGWISFVPAPGYEAYGEAIDREGHFMVEVDSTQKPDERCVGDNVEVKKLKWRKIDGPFVSVWLHVPWGGEDTKAAPDAKFSDGYRDLILIKDCPKLSLLSLTTALGDGSHVKSPHVVHIRVKAFMLSPGPRAKDSSKEGFIDLDGEVLARGKGTYKCDHKALMAYYKLQIKVDRGLVTVFSPV